MTLKPFSYFLVVKFSHNSRLILNYEMHLDEIKIDLPLNIDCPSELKEKEKKTVRKHPMCTTFTAMYIANRNSSSTLSQQCAGAKRIAHIKAIITPELQSVAMTSTSSPQTFSS